MLYMVQLDKRSHSVLVLKLTYQQKRMFSRLSVNDADATGHICVYGLSSRFPVSSWHVQAHVV